MAGLVGDHVQAAIKKYCGQLFLLSPELWPSYMTWRNFWDFVGLHVEPQNDPPIKDNKDHHKQNMMTLLYSGIQSK